MYFDSKQVSLYFSLLGLRRTGKHSIIHRYLKNTYPDNKRYNRSIGYSYKYFFENEMFYSIKVWNHTVDYYLDQLKFYQYIVSGVLLIYSIEYKDSFEKIQEIAKELEEVIKNNKKKPIIFLVGNNRYRKKEREVSKEEAIDFCNQHNYKYFECSAFTWYNIHEIFS